MKAFVRSMFVGLFSFLILTSGQIASAQCVSGGLTVGTGNGVLSVGGASSDCGYGGGAFGRGFMPAPWLSNPFALPNASIMTIVSGITYWLLAILGFLGIIGFVIAGIMYLLAAGDEKQAGTAKNALKYSIYGIVTALLGFIVIRAATAMLSGIGGF